MKKKKNLGFNFELLLLPLENEDKNLKLESDGG